MSGYVYTVLAVLLLPVNAVAQPLYLGEMEVDTADREAVAAVVERCAALAQTAPDAEVVAAFTLEQPLVQENGRAVETNSAPIGGAAAETMPLAIGTEAMISEEQDSGPAGEGAGEGTEAQDESDAPQEASSESDLTTITLEACKEAGLVF